MEANERVPYFRFEDREFGVDEAASKERGYEVPQLKTFILITPHGHRGDPMEFFAEDFIERKEAEVKNQRYSYEWLQAFKAGLAAYRDGKAIPRDGIPLVTWERILKRRREQLAQRYPTVEELAAVPDSSLGDIGLDGRVLRDIARADIQAKKDLSPVVKELADANETIRRLQTQLDKQNEKIDKLLKQRDK